MQSRHIDEQSEGVGRRSLQWLMVLMAGLFALSVAVSSSLAQGSEGRSSESRPESPPTTAGTPEPQPVEPQPVEPQPAEPAAAEEPTAAEEPEAELLNTDAAQGLTYSQHADRRPGFSSDGGWIVFETDRDGQWEIYRMRIDGTRQERLTHHPADDRSPSLSPDGRYLAFQSNRKPGDRRSDLYLLDLELDELTLVSDAEADEAFPRFSPDGRWLLYTASPEGNTDLYRRPLSGSPPVPGPAERLTDHEGNDVWGSYDADGASIVYFSRRGDQDDIYRLDIASGENERLTEHPSNDFVPTLSPDGRWLAFASNRRGAGQTRVFIQDLEGKLPLAELEEDNWAGEPAFSPDGRHLAFVSGRSRNFEIVLWELPSR